MDQPNIILIVLDTLRKDVLSMYGGNAYTPNLNEFAKDAVVFQNAMHQDPGPYPLMHHFLPDYIQGNMVFMMTVMNRIIQNF